MDFREQLAYTERIIAPYKEQLSEITLFDIYKFLIEYWLDGPGDYTGKEFDEIDLIQEFEIKDMIDYILYADGFPVYETYDDYDDYESF